MLWKAFYKAVLVVDNASEEPTSAVNARLDDVPGSDEPILQKALLVSVVVVTKNKC